MTNCYTTKLTDKEICKINKYIKTKLLLVIVIFGTDNNLKAMEYLNFVLENIKLNFVFIVCKCTCIMVVEQ